MSYLASTGCMCATPFAHFSNIFKDSHRANPDAMVDVATAVYGLGCGHLQYGGVAHLDQMICEKCKTLQSATLISQADKDLLVKFFSESQTEPVLQRGSSRSQMRDFLDDFRLVTVSTEVKEYLAEVYGTFSPTET